MENKNWKIVHWVGAVIILAISIFHTSKYIYQNTGETQEYKYHWDERLWTAASIADYNMYFKGYTRDFTDMDTWFTTYALMEGVDTTKMARSEKQWYDRNMWTAGWKAHTIGKYFMGFMAVNFGGKVDPQGYFYRWDKPIAGGQAPGAYTPDMLVQLARWPNSIMNILTILLILFIGWRYFSFWVGFVASLILAVNKNLFQVSNMAGVDGGGLFFSTLTIALALLYLESFRDTEKQKRAILLSIGIGISFPIAVGWKFSAALVGYAAVATFALLALMMFVKYLFPTVEKKQTIVQNIAKGKHAPVKKKAATVDSIKVSAFRSVQLKLFARMGISGAIIAVLTWIIFVYSNPILYHQPLKKVKIINESVNEFFKRRAISSGHYKLTTDKTYATEMYIKRNLINEDPKGVYHGTIGSYLKFKYNLLDGLLFLVGFILLFLSGLQSFKEGHVNPALLVSLCAIIILYGTIGFLWADYNRYYVPTYTMNALCSGFAVWKFGSLFKKRR